MSKLSLKMKLAVGFGTLLIILVVIATVAYTAVGSLAEAAKEVGRKASEKEMLVKIELAVAKGRSGSASYLLLDRNEALEVDEEGKRDYKDSIEELTPLVHSDEGKRLFSEVQHSYDNLRAVSDKEVQLRRSGKTKDAIQTLTRESDPAFKQLHENVKAFTSYLDKGLEEADKRQVATVSRCRVLILTLAALGFLLGAAVSGMTIRSIRSIMFRLVATMQRVAANDLATDDAEITTEDEIGQAGTAFNRMKNSLREMIQSIAGTAQHVASASEELSSSATQQAQSAETQKDQTAQVATAMQEMSSTVLQVSENSNKAAEASRQAAETARRGGAIVEETLSRMRAIADSVSSTAKKMDELGKSSDQIGQIVGVINDIADQTNLLALNAAIEAARAGERSYRHGNRHQAGRRGSEVDHPSGRLAEGNHPHGRASGRDGHADCYCGDGAIERFRRSESEYGEDRQIGEGIGRWRAAVGQSLPGPLQPRFRSAEHGWHFQARLRRVRSPWHNSAFCCNCPGVSSFGALTCQVTNM